MEVKNVNGTSNSGGNITHELECNVFYRGHHERLRMDVCNLGRTKMILGMPLMRVTKVKLLIKLVCPFIRDKGDRCKSEFCNLRDGSQLYANK